MRCVVGDDDDGGGSVWALLNKGSEEEEEVLDFDGVDTKTRSSSSSTSSSSSSDTVYACLSLDGDVIGEAPLLLVGGVAGRPPDMVGELGEAGRRNGDERGELLKVDL